MGEPSGGKQSRGTEDSNLVKKNVKNSGRRGVYPMGQYHVKKKWKKKKEQGGRLKGTCPRTHHGGVGRRANKEKEKGKRILELGGRKT